MVHRRREGVATGFRRAVRALGEFCLLQPCLVLLIILCALLPLGLRPPERAADPFDSDRPVAVHGTITSCRRSGESHQLLLEVRHAEQAGRPVSVGRRLDLYVPASHLDAPCPAEWSPGRAVSFLAPLRRPQAYLTPGVTDPGLDRWIDDRPYYAALKSAVQLEITSEPPSLAQRLALLPDRLAVHFEEGTERLDPPVAALVRAAVLGDTQALSPEMWEQFTKLGLAHLLVVSGYHVLVLTVFLRRILHPGSRTSLVVVLAAVWLYAALTGARPPTTRAALFTSLALTAAYRGWEVRPLNLLGAAGFLLLLTNPRQVYATSFQLTLLSVLAIILSLPLLRKVQALERVGRDLREERLVLGRRDHLRFRRRLRFRLEYWAFPYGHRLQHPAFGGTLAAAGQAAGIFLLTWNIQIFLAPLLFRVSNQFPLGGPFFNLLFVPPFSLWLPLAWVHLLLFPTPFGSASARLVSITGGWLLAGVERLTRYALCLYGPAPSRLSLFLAYALLGTALAVPRLPRPTRWGLLAAALLPLGLAQPPPPDGLLTLTLLDVGQAETLHVCYPDGSHALIDCAGARLDRSNRRLAHSVVARYLYQRRAPSLRFLLVSHPEQDHAGTLPLLAERLRIERVLGFDRPRRLPPDVPYVPLQEGEAFRVGGVEHFILHPVRPSPFTSANDRSLVILLRYGRFTFLATGDISASVEGTLAGRLRPIDVLKVPHHGSRTSSSPAFLAAVRPRIAVISCGRRNPFGLPDPTVVERLRKTGALVFTTATDGTLQIVTDGRTFTVWGYTGRRFRLLAGGEAGSLVAEGKVLQKSVPRPGTGKLSSLGN